MPLLMTCLGRSSPCWFTGQSDEECNILFPLLWQAMKSGIIMAVMRVHERPVQCFSHGHSLHSTSAVYQNNDALHTVSYRKP
jgi:hypothetical protein